MYIIIYIKQLRYEQNRAAKVQKLRRLLMRRALIYNTVLRDCPVEMSDPYRPVVAPELNDAFERSRCLTRHDEENEVEMSKKIDAK